jgi:TctA family transporter
VTLATVGGLTGGLAGLVPGLHPNTLAAGALAVEARWGLPALPTIAFLMAALGAWTFTSALPLVVLGVPEGELAPALHPGQRLARGGHAEEALTASATGSLAGLALGVPAALAIAHLLTAPGARAAIQAATPWVAGIALLVLVASDPAGPPTAALVALAAGLLGHVGLAVPVTSPLGWPATPLLPLFIGLFGLPALVHAARSPPPDHEPLPGEDGHVPTPARRGPIVGSLLGLVSGVFSGFTAGPATAVAAQVGHQRETSLMATVGAVNTASVCVATGVLHALQRPRTGVHAARLALAWPIPGWDALVGDLAAMATGGLVGLVGLGLACRHAEALAAHVPGLARGLVVPWLVGIGLFTGWAGGLVCLAGWTLARAAHAAGARRSLLMATLLGPALVRGLTG